MVLSIITAALNGCMAVTCAIMIFFFATTAEFEINNYSYYYGYDVSTCVFLTPFHLTYHRDAKMHMIDLCVQIIINSHTRILVHVIQ